MRSDHCRPSAGLQHERLAWWVCPGAGVGESRADVGALPEQMWAQSRADVGPAIGKAAANPGADVDKQRLSAAEAHVRVFVGAREWARVRALLRWYGFRSILTSNFLCCCRCARAHT
jgi:hypothetical protein